MRTIGSLARTIRLHPWSSLQDAALLATAMLVGLLLAFEYDFLVFWDDLTPRQRRIRLDEVFFLSCLLALGIFAFILRRLHEERLDLERQLRVESDVREIRALAMQDSLTTLPNRRAIEAALDEAVATGHGRGTAFALYLLDLNGFKRVNDEHGHAMGDELLRAVAQRLRGATRREDLLARLGGDEFAVLASGVEGRDKAAEIGQRLVAAFASNIQLGRHTFPLGIAVGVALYPQDGASVAEIMNRADVAMYTAKAGHQSALRFFESTRPPARERTA